jgi:hypothetical protein
LVAHLAALVLVGDLAAPEAVPAPPPAAVAPEAPRTDLDRLNEDELALQLMNRLDQLGGREST